MPARLGQVLLGVMGAALIAAAAFIWHLESQIDELKNPANSELQTASLEKQKLCAERADKVYRDAGWNVNGPTDGMFSDYSDHYDPNTKQCFMFLHITSIGKDGGVFESASVSDAFEGRDYGSYASLDPKGGTPHITACFKGTQDKHLQECSSKEEWLRLMQPYMETAAAERSQRPN